MKFLIDNNLSFKLVRDLNTLFPETEHVSRTVGIFASDQLIWDFAKENGFVILTKDNDFDERSQIYGCPPKVVHLVCGNQTTSSIYGIILKYQKDLHEFGMYDNENCILKIV